MKIRFNENEEIVRTIKEGLKRTGGYCPCRLKRTEVSWYSNGPTSKVSIWLIGK